MNSVQKYSEYSDNFRICLTNGFTTREYRGVGKHITLNAERQYVVGIDQSSKQTGIAIRAYGCERKILYLIDFVNYGMPDKETYIAMIRETLRLIFEGIKVLAVIIEMPLEIGGNNPYTQARLMEVKGMMNQLRIDVDSFHTAEWSSLPPTMWRKHYLANPTYTGRKTTTEDVKASTVEEGCLRYPLLKDYCSYYNRPMDSFDALGILEGGLEEVYYHGDLSIKRVNNTMRATVQNYEAEFDTIPKDTDGLEDLVTDVVGNYFDDPMDQVEDRGVKVFVCDELKDDVDSYIRKVVSTTNSFCAILFRLKNRKHYGLLKWAKELACDEQSAYVCYCWRSNPDKRKDNADSFPSYVEPVELYDDEISAMEDSYV